ncbi:MAG: hypothetical protein IJA17_10300 [Oscillospiraceae bacterium]|nr:hypothetical protein [Oscillospiraceae bacterium]
MDKQCSNCEFNMNRICVGNSNLYHYGETIIDDTNFCDGWGADLNFFTEQIALAPRFLRDAYINCKIDYETFSQEIDDLESGNAVPINIFDAIKYIYGISMVDIAVLLDVTYGVVYNAKTRGFAKKRLSQFADGLCIPEKILLNTTTDDFDELKRCKELFFSKPKTNSTLENMPDWKNDLAQEISSNVVNCPIHIAKILSRVDSLYWKEGFSLDSYTESEKVFINYMLRNTKKHKPVHYLKYFLDIANRPNFEIHK